MRIIAVEGRAVHDRVKFRLGVLSAAIAASAVVVSCTGGRVVTTTGSVPASTAAPSTTQTIAPRPGTVPLVTASPVRPVGIVLYGCETLWPGHRAAHSLTFEGGEVINALGVQQGVLTLAGQERLRKLLAAIDSTGIPDHFEGEARSQEGFLGLVGEGFFETACELRLDLGETVGVYTWDEWPADELVDLHSFLIEAVRPLLKCETTYAIEVAKPCSYIGID